MMCTGSSSRSLHDRARVSIPRTSRELADGRVFTGEQAMVAGLVDTIGTYEDAIQITAELAGIEGEPSLVRETKRRTWLESMTGDVTEQVRAAIRRMLSWPVMSFRFTGRQ